MANPNRHPAGSSQGGEFAPGPGGGGVGVSNERIIQGKRVKIPRGAVGAFSTVSRSRTAHIHAPGCKHAPAIATNKVSPFEPTQYEISDLEERGFKVKLAPCSK